MKPKTVRDKPMTIKPKQYIHAKECSWKEFDGKKEACECRNRQPKQSKQAHTPTPWRLKEEWIITDSKGDTIAEVIGYSGGFEQKPNGPFIVRACNSHEELLEVCHDLIESTKSGDSAYLDQAVRKAKKAIAKANSNT